MLVALNIRITNNDFSLNMVNSYYAGSFLVVKG
jgi:hypothetical protein